MEGVRGMESESVEGGVQDGVMRGSWRSGRQRDGVGEWWEGEEVVRRSRSRDSRMWLKC